jgi:hypothetical protein
MVFPSRRAALRACERKVTGIQCGRLVVAGDAVFAWLTLWLALAANDSTDH